MRVIFLFALGNEWATIVKVPHRISDKYPGKTL